MSHTHRDDLALVEPEQEVTIEHEPPAPVVVTSNAEAERAAARARGEEVSRAPAQARTFRGDGDDGGEGGAITGGTSTAADLVEVDTSLAKGGATCAGPPAPRWTQPFGDSPWLGIYSFDARALPEHAGPNWFRAHHDRPIASVAAGVPWIAKRP